MKSTADERTHEIYASCDELHLARMSCWNICLFCAVDEVVSANHCCFHLSLLFPIVIVQYFTDVIADVAADVMADVMADATADVMPDAWVS